MAEAMDTTTLQLLLIGLAVVAASLIRAITSRYALPALVGYLLLGFLLRLADARWAFLTDTIYAGFALLANLGLVALLFDVGLTSHPKALAGKLPAASLIWLGDMAIAFAVGFLAAYLLLGLAMVPSLFIGTALTATSVGVAVSVWKELGALDSPDGQLILDVAELDDIGGVALLALLLAAMPVLARGGSPWGALGGTLGLLVLKLAAFAGLCYLLSRYLERRSTRGDASAGPPEQYMVTVAGAGFVIAALANGLGFSLAIGALFAGLVFSHDRTAVRAERSFRNLYAFLTPFFFINLGLHVDPASLTGAAGLTAVLLPAAIIGKLAGDGLPAWLVTGAGGAAAIAVSMIPRAEIAMIVMHYGRTAGPQAVPAELYSAMVAVSALTCLLTPLALRPLLARHAMG